jgi:hypothetical protein
LGFNWQLALPLTAELLYTIPGISTVAEPHPPGQDVPLGQSPEQALWCSNLPRNRICQKDNPGSLSGWCCSGTGQAGTGHRAGHQLSSQPRQHYQTCRPGSADSGLVLQWHRIFRAHTAHKPPAGACTTRPRSSFRCRWLLAECRHICRLGTLCTAGIGFLARNTRESKNTSLNRRHYPSAHCW